MAPLTERLAASEKCEAKYKARPRWLREIDRPNPMTIRQRYLDLSLGAAPRADHHVFGWRSSPLSHPCCS